MDKGELKEAIYDYQAMHTAVGTNVMEDFFSRPSPPDIVRYVDLMLSISERAHQCLCAKGWSVKELSEAIGESEAIIEVWIGGGHNLTIKEIAKLESALSMDLIEVKD